MQLDLLAIGAHPDDVELCCGGTILKHVDQGYKAGIIDLTRGELGTRGTAEIRQQEAQNAATKLGVSVRENLNLPDGFIANRKAHQLPLIEKIRQYRPQIVLANAVTDRHPDHGRAAELVEEACFKAGLAKIETTVDGSPQERWRPKCVFHYVQFRYIPPDIVVDITPYIKQRMEAAQCYESQFYDPNSEEPETVLTDPEFFDIINARAREYGRTIGVDYAEAFTTYQEVGVPDLLQLEVFN